MDLHRLHQSLHQHRNHPIARMRSLAVALAIAMLASTGFAASHVQAADAPRLSGVVNVNTATPDELQLLPGVGESRAAAIVDTRKAKGGFKSVDELAQVKGVGDKLLERMRPFVTLKGKTTARRL